jgi:hypothetical protein
MITTVFARPFTGKLTSAQIELMAFYSPAHAEEHLVHAWLALKSALLADEREMCRIEYAKNRLACLESAPVVAGVKSRQMKAFRLEVESLRAAIEAHKL